MKHLGNIYTPIPNEFVKVEYPLKQGLKPVLLIVLKLFIFTVKVEYPLKQGLKHRYLLYLLHLEHRLK